jgi:hypothetical protein
VSRIQPFDLYIDVNTNQMHYAWQAGIRRSIFSLFRLGGVSYEHRRWPQAANLIEKRNFVYAPT